VPWALRWGVGNTALGQNFKYNALLYDCKTTKLKLINQHNNVILIKHLPFMNEHEFVEFKFVRAETKLLVSNVDCSIMLQSYSVVYEYMQT